MKYLQSFIFFFITAVVLYAQPTTGNGNGSLIIEQDPTIDTLVSAKGSTNPQITDPNITTQKPKAGALINTGNPQEDDKTNINLIKEKFGGCIPYPKNGMVNGYKIQIDRFKTHAEAQAKLNAFVKNFPNISSTIYYEVPNYKVYVGNYLSAKTMETDLRKIRKFFPGSFSVQAKVFIDRGIWNERYCR